MKDLATAYICIHTRKLNCANIPPPVSFFLRLQRHPNGPRPVYMLSAIFRDDLFFFEFFERLSERGGQEAREGGNADSREEGV